MDFFKKANRYFDFEDDSPEVKNYSKQQKSKVKIKRITIWGIVGLIILFLIIFNPASSPDITKNTPESLNVSTEPPINAIYINFKDMNNSCFLDGTISIDGKNIGETNQNYFYLTKPQYDQLFTSNSILKLNGTTGYCFGKDSDLPFVLSWDLSDLNYYFNTGQNLTLETSTLDPRNPEGYAFDFESYYQIIQGFIRPSETLDYYTREVEKYLKNDTRKDLDQVAGFNMNYRGNALLFGKNYWRTTSEFLKEGREGDCKDWSLLTLSMIENYNSSLDCYLTLWSGSSEVGHINVLCHYGDNFIIYDQDQVSSRVSISQESLNSAGLVGSKIKIRQMVNNYYSEYGLPSQDVIYSLINSKKIIIFNETENNEEFINWVINQVNN